jgi:hypothetical protein
LFRLVIEFGLLHPLRLIVILLFLMAYL